MFDTSKVRDFAAGLSNEVLTREISEAQLILERFDPKRIQRCKDERLQEKLQRVGGVGAAVLLVAATLGVGLLVAGAAGAAGAGALAARATAALTSGPLESSCKFASEQIQSLTDADYLASYLLLESRLQVLVSERDRRKRKADGQAEGESFWSRLKLKAMALVEESSKGNSRDHAIERRPVPPKPQPQPPTPRQLGNWRCGHPKGPGETRCWTCVLSK